MGVKCPDCRIPLSDVVSGAIVAQRCQRCRGIWLDPASFERLCDDEVRSPDEAPALPGPAPAPRAPPRAATGAARADAPVRYRPCPACGEVMNRTNFARVSGVVLDVCRPHGAWFDRGELAAIRRFLREGGAARYARHRRMSDEVTLSHGGGRAPPGTAAAGDLYDVLVGGDSPWDVPGRVPRLLLALGFAGVGAWLLWRAFHPRGFMSTRFLDGGAAAGVLCLYLAWRPLWSWVTRARR